MSQLHCLSEELRSGLAEEPQLNQKQNPGSHWSPSQLQGYVKEQKSHPWAQTQRLDCLLLCHPLLQTPLEVVKQICISESPSVWVCIRISVIITAGPKVLGKHFNRLVPWLQREDLTQRVNYLTPSSTLPQGCLVCLFQGASQLSLFFDTIIPAQWLPVKNSWEFLS